MRKKTWLLPLLIALLLWMAQPLRVVQAHANLVRSDPAQGDVLASFPAAVQMEFSEAVARNSIRVELLNERGQVLGQGAVTLSPANPKVLSVTFAVQPDGIYSIRYQVQSAQDGHITDGALSFSVGQNAPLASLLPPPGAPDPAADLPRALDVMLRGLGYISILLVVGPALFGVYIWRQAFRSIENAPAHWDETFTRWLRLLMVWGGTAGIWSLIGLVIWQDYQLNRISGVSSFNIGLLAPVTWILWLRLAVLVAMIVLAVVLPRAGQGNPLLWWISVGLGGPLIITYSLMGHNAAIGGAMPVIEDGLHIAAMAAWVGGLLPLTVVLLRWGRLKEDAALALSASASKRFSSLALSGVILLGITGLYSALMQVRTLGALLGTRYGQALMLKSLLFAVLVGFGAVNQKLLLPRMTRSDVRAFQWLGRSVRVEYGLALGLLFVVGGLMSLSPAYAALQAEQKMGFHESYRDGRVRIDLRAAPAAVGQNEFGVDIVDNRPGADQVKPQVLLRFHLQMQSMDMGTTQVEAVPPAAPQAAAPQAEPPGSQRFTARGSYLSILGPWQVEVILRKPGFDDVRHAFLIDLEKFLGD